MELYNFNVMDYVLVIVLIGVVLSVGVLVFDKQTKSMNDCGQFGAAVKLSNSSCDWWNKKCQLGLCVWPNGTEFFTSDLLVYNLDINDWGSTMALVVTLSIVLTVIVSFIARWKRVK